MSQYTVDKLSKISGVTVRALHHYDKIGLLKPAFRTEKNYRIYSEKELYQLQQILIHKELGFSLSEISDILNDENLNWQKVLKEQKKKLKKEQARIAVLLKTIDKTLLKLKGKQMINDEELYKGFSKKEIAKIRKESIKKFGKNNVEVSEKYLKSRSKEEFEQLKKEQKEIFANLLALIKEEADSEMVQLEIAKHYANTRSFWGTHGHSNAQKEEYQGLGKLYLSDERYTQKEAKQHPDFPEFISKAIEHFTLTQL